MPWIESSEGGGLPVRGSLTWVRLSLPVPVPASATTVCGTYLLVAWWVQDQFPNDGSRDVKLVE
ncbi:hypothetical protein [Methylomonas sp. TEB]|uniref:hypothetical protein n=1 Tax=Methylomonas sp. TEB TaxID=3398229 RepID=UPI0039F48751